MPKCARQTDSPDEPKKKCSVCCKKGRWWEMQPNGVRCNMLQHVATCCPKHRSTSFRTKSVRSPARIWTLLLRIPGFEPWIIQVHESMTKTWLEVHQRRIQIGVVLSHSSASRAMASYTPSFLQADSRCSMLCLMFLSKLDGAFPRVVEHDLCTDTFSCIICLGTVDSIIW